MAWKILVVDDEVDVELIFRQIFRKNIQRQEMDFHFARNGKEALNTIKRNKKIDLVVSDINMPEMDGLTLLHEIKKLNIAMVAVIISAYDDMANIRNAMNQGAFDFLTKPLDMEDLEITLTKSLLHVQQGKESIRLQLENEKARSENMAKSEFLSSISHEMRTPLHAIIGMTDLLLESSLSAEQREYVEILDSAGNVLLDLINNVLDMSKIEAGYMNLDSVEFNLHDLIFQVVRIMEFRCQAKGIAIHLLVGPDIPQKMIGDPIRIRQILMNLIGNSVKFTDEGEIRLKVCFSPTNSEELLFCISDTGIGIPKDQQISIFEKFSQGNLSGAQKSTGSGLGLAISRRLVEAMGGKIWMESNGKTGSKFSFTIQLDFEKEEDQSEERIPNEEFDTVMAIENYQAPPQNECKPLEILLADDSSHNQRIIELFMKRMPLKLTFVSHGLEAVNSYKSKAFDLVFMDMQMPVMDGYAATREIRLWETHKKLTRTPIIGVTAAAFTEEIQNALNAGCDEVMLKPFRKDTVISIINKYKKWNRNQGQIDSESFGENFEKEIFVSKELKDLVEIYLNDMKKELMSYFSALNTKDFEKIKILSHRMKGNGGTFGLQFLSVIGGQIEEAAKTENIDILQQLLRRLSSFYEVVTISTSMPNRQ